jgi:hypothetical protein
MPTCGNCGAFVSPQYVRVFAPDGYDTVRACPQCPDRVREGAQVREARSSRQGQGAVGRGAAETDAEGRFMSTGGEDE